MWSACDCVANSGSSRLRCRGYSATTEASKPRSLSTSETRTLKVPKSTPATTAIPFLRQKTDRQIANNKSKTLALSSWIILHAINQAQNHQKPAPPYRCVQIRENGRGRMRPFRQSAHQNQESIHQQQKTDEKPDGNDVMSLAHSVSPENDLQNYQKQKGPRAPHYRAMKPARLLLVRHLCESIDQPFQLVIRLRLGHQGHEHGDHHARHTRPQRLVHILREPLGFRGKREHAHPAMIELHQAEHSDR